jgi:hypothetical protein
MTPSALRILSLDPLDHPRGQAHLSSASGLVCAYGRVYVVADDEHHLAVYDDVDAPGRLIRLFPGDLPEPKKARKKRKPDTETLMLWPACEPWPHGALLALGSGSRPRRRSAVAVPLQADGEPVLPVHRIDLTSLYVPLSERFAQLNIEGAMRLGDEFVLLQRGNKGGSPNALIHLPLEEIDALLHGRPHGALKPLHVRGVDLGNVDGIPLCFTDGKPLPDGRWVFTAVAENTDDSYADGACAGAALGVMGAAGEVEQLHRLSDPLKIEGVDAHIDGNVLFVCLVTDADDPRQASRLLMAQLDLA